MYERVILFLSNRVDRIRSIHIFIYIHVENIFLSIRIYDICPRFFPLRILSTQFKSSTIFKPLTVKQIVRSKSARINSFSRFPFRENIFSRSPIDVLGSVHKRLSNARHITSVETSALWAAHACHTADYLSTRTRESYIYI